MLVIWKVDVFYNGEGSLLRAMDPPVINNI